MCHCNPIEKLQNIHWDVYQKSALNGQIASGILVLITAVAVGVILFLHPQISYMHANYEAMITFAVVGGLSLTTFVVCSCMRHYGTRRASQNVENRQCIEAMVSLQPATPIALEATTTITESPIDYVKQAIIQPLLKAFNDAIKHVIAADCVTTDKSIGTKIEEINSCFQTGAEICNHFLDDQQIYVSELLRSFGPGKSIKASVALRRLIAACNSGDLEKLAEVEAEYNRVMQANDFSEIAEALSSQPPATLMQTLPELLERRFALSDETLKAMGRNILTHIFAQARAKPDVLSALETLKAKADSDHLAKEVEKFVKLVLVEAAISPEKYKEWNDELIKYMLDTTFKKSLCDFLRLAALNIRMLKVLFNKKLEQKKLFIQLDETFLLSESWDCVKQEELQNEIFHLQSEINYDRKEANRIAFIALPLDTGVQGSKKQEGVMELCLQANQNSRKDLDKFTNSERVIELGHKHGVSLVAIPVSISDHPFKAFKKKERWIRFGGAIATSLPESLLQKLTAFILDLVEPKLMELLPQMDEKEQEDFKALLKNLLSLLIYPIYDGAIGNTAFRQPFEEVITTKGEDLADQIDKLLLDEEITFEKMRDAWTGAVHEVALKFQQLGQKNVNC